jgi:NADPH2:quinone reductase
VRIGHEFPLANAADAHRELESRRTTGKVLLIP